MSDNDNYISHAPSGAILIRIGPAKPRRFQRLRNWWMLRRRPTFVQMGMIDGEDDD